jgi:hypothetical protein
MFRPAMFRPTIFANNSSANNSSANNCFCQRAALFLRESKKAVDYMMIFVVVSSWAAPPCPVCGELRQPDSHARR